MQKINNKNLLTDFESKCKEELKITVDKELFGSFVNGNVLDLNLDKIRTQDIIVIPLLIKLPYKQIRIFKDNLLSNSSQNIQNNNELIKNQINHLQIIIKALSQSLLKQHSKHLRSIKFQNLPFVSNHLHIITKNIQKTKYLKQLSFIKCSLNDSHLQILKDSLSQNISLNSIDFSSNQFQQIGQFIIYILSKHAQRKQHIYDFYSKHNKTSEFNISDTGIFQINLQGNQITSKSIEQLSMFLQNDKWVKSINLKQNQLEQKDINKFSTVLQSNSTLVNLDLRLNPGFNKKNSKLIFLKLKQNLSKIKTTNVINKPINISKSHSNSQNNILLTSSQIQTHQQLSSEKEKIKLQKNYHQNSNQFRQFNKQLTKSDLFSNRLQKNLNAKVFIKSPSELKNQSNHHSNHKLINDNKNIHHQLSNFAKIQKQGDTQDIKILHNKFESTQKQKQKNQLHEGKKIMRISSDETIKKQCSKCQKLQKKLIQVQKKCNQMHIKTLKAEKQNLQLEIELKKLKLFLQKNRDVSMIGTSANKIIFQNPQQLYNQNSNVSTSFNRVLGSQNDEEMISRIQILVTQLTRIMETVEQFQNTQNTIDHPFSNVNSFSKTISLYERRPQLIEIQQQILEDQALHLEQFENESITLIQNSPIAQQKILESQSDIQKKGKNKFNEKK